MIKNKFILLMIFSTLLIFILGCNKNYTDQQIKTELSKLSDVELKTLIQDANHNISGSLFSEFSKTRRIGTIYVNLDDIFPLLEQELNNRETPDRRLLGGGRNYRTVSPVHDIPKDPAECTTKCTDNCMKTTNSGFIGCNDQCADKCYK